MSHGIGKGDAVFTTNFSFFATAEVISLVGATPIFVDIDEDTFNLNYKLLDLEINRVKKEGNLNPKCIIAVDLFGLPAEYNKISKIAKKNNLLLIEDAAQSFGATYDDKKTCSFGDIAATSFYPAKPFGCYGDGGAIFTNDSKIAEICRSIRVHGQGTDKYDNIRVGINSRLDTIQAAVLINKFEIFDEELRLRNLIAKKYTTLLMDYVKTPYIPNNCKSSWAQYSIIIENREPMIEKLNNNKIPTAIFYKIPFNKNPIFNSNGNYAISNKVSKKILSLPMHPYLDENDIKKIADLFKN
mgnify:CR=1 FL=1